MIRQKSLATEIVLTLITCGIYGIFWFIALTNDVGELSGDPEFTGGKHFLLTIVTCGIWGFIWAYQVGKHIAEAQHRRGQFVTDNSVLYLVLNFVGLSIVVYALVQSDVNKLAQA
ncbi:DUF4234 domain-containing protein [Paenibacillus psychroresistens]|uniref:DUF4234 domain-containing protein n=1 Tax=Paenibacillus psychroresistens TaxID=1778678 RepID=A0A6B8RNY2_9BACL|nr:DUF4234 domain-containing protein [Paenibacillus psychroresistens]QGQ97504.1 DUF4234 domain-containing protein [Paenibacillus psychroresistens]